MGWNNRGWVGKGCSKIQTSTLGTVINCNMFNQQRTDFPCTHAPHLKQMSNLAP